MDLTVCICTHDRPRYVRDCLDGLRRQTAPRDRFTILLVDSGSSPAAAAELAASGDRHGARLIRLDHPGVSLARNAGAWAARTPYIAYIDDDAIPAHDWVETILTAVAQPGRPPALIGGRILPKWEAPLPAWWPGSLRGVLSIIEHEGRGEYRTEAVPEEPGALCGQHRRACAVAARRRRLWRHDRPLRPARCCRMRKSSLPGCCRMPAIRCDTIPRITVHHQIQARRLEPEWLLSRLYWQGASTVLTRRLLQQPGSVWRELPRRLLVAALLAPACLIPRHSTFLLGARWRVAYATGFIRAAFGWHATAAAIQQASVPVAA